MKINSKYIQATVTLISLCLLASYTMYQTYRPKEWYEESNMVVHALGEIDGHPYTNSKEAFEKSYSNGYKIFEIDLLYTSDKHLVLRHNYKDELGQSNIDGKNIPDYDTFMSTPMWNKYTPLNIENIILYLNTYPEIYFVTDIKGRIFDEALNDIISAAEEMGYESVLDRFIIQIYSKEDYETASKKNSFKHYIFTTYRQFSKNRPTAEDIKSINDFCLMNNIDAITVNKKYLTKKLMPHWQQLDLPLFIHTITDNNTILDYVKQGVDRFYIDDTTK